MRYRNAALFLALSAAWGSAFAATTAFALGSVVDRPLDADPTMGTIAAWAMLSGVLLVDAVSLALGKPQPFEPTVGALVSLGYLSLVASAAGFLIYFDLLDRLGPIEINLKYDFVITMRYTNPRRMRPIRADGPCS